MGGKYQIMPAYDLFFPFYCFITGNLPFYTSLIPDEFNEFQNIFKRENSNNSDRLDCLAEHMIFIHIIQVLVEFKGKQLRLILSS